jgi:hypothetical protein
MPPPPSHRSLSDEDSNRLDATQLFKKKLLDAIRDGTKTQTICLWKHRRMRAGQRSDIPGVGPICITVVEQVDLDGLRDADAMPDGLASARASQTELRSIYGKQLAESPQVYRVVFRRLFE